MGREQRADYGIKGQEGRRKGSGSPRREKPPPPPPPLYLAPLVLSRSVHSVSSRLVLARLVDGNSSRRVVNFSTSRSFSCTPSPGSFSLPAARKLTRPPFVACFAAGERWRAQPKNETEIPRLPPRLAGSSASLFSLSLFIRWLEVTALLNENQNGVAVAPFSGEIRWRAGNRCSRRCDEWNKTKLWVISRAAGKFRG